MGTIVAAIQHLLKASGVPILVDGVWGPKSRAAFLGAPAAIKNAILKVADYFDMDTDMFEPAILDKTIWIPESQAYVYADVASRSAGLDPAVLRWMLEREPERQLEDGVWYYNIKSISPNGKYKGLFQIGQAGWDDAQSISKAPFNSIGNYSMNWSAPQTNAYAAAGLVLKNMLYAKQIHKYNGPFTPQVIYAMHNQGHSFLSSAKKGGIGRFSSNQSDEARKDLLAAAKTVRASYG
jgi:hypothetical protein